MNELAEPPSSAAKPVPVTLLVAVGGAFGALARVGVEALLPTMSMADPRFPWATFAVNVAGALVLGAVMALCELRPHAPRWLRPLAAIGFCGSFTTFSTMSVDFVQLVESRHAWLAIGYFAASFATGVMAAFVGRMYTLSVVSRTAVTSSVKTSFATSLS